MCVGGGLQIYTSEIHSAMNAHIILYYFAEYTRLKESQIAGKYYISKMAAARLRNHGFVSNVPSQINILVTNKLFEHGLCPLKVLHHSHLISAEC